MDKKREIRLISIFTIAYAFFFTLLAYLTKNYEFVYYTIVISSLLAIIVLHYKQLHLKVAILWGLSILGLMHLAGGTINIYGIRLYDFWFIDNLLKYGAVVFLDAQEAVGDYFNNAADLVFNLIGSVIAVFFIHSYHKKRIAKKS